MFDFAGKHIKNPILFMRECIQKIGGMTILGNFILYNVILNFSIAPLVDEINVVKVLCSKTL